MKTKLTVLAATLIVGFSASNAPASPPNWDFYATKVTPAVQTAHAARSPGFKACFETRANVTTGPTKGSSQAIPTTVCNTGCNMPHAGKACSTNALKHCSAKA